MAISKNQQQHQNQQSPETKTWPDFAVSLYDKLTGRGAQISYEFVNFEVDIPSKMGQGASHAHWRMNGTINIRTSDLVNTDEQDTQ